MSRPLFIWGTPPPPLGGMTVHLERLESNLKERGIQCVMHNFKGGVHPRTDVVNVSSFPFWYLKLLFGRSRKVHYVITSNALVRFLATFLGFINRDKVVIRVGGESLAESIKKGGIYKMVSVFAVKKCSLFIGVSDEIVTTAKEIRGDQGVFLIPGFIAPKLDESKVLEKEISDFLKNSTLNLLFSGRVFKRTERDIYGIWLLVESVEKLVNEGLDIKVVLCVYDQDELDDSSDLEEYIRQNDLSKNLKIVKNNNDLVALFQHFDLFIRSTITDGDSNALREALASKIPCLASDVVKRPDGCILFKNNDPLDLASQIKYVLNNYNSIRANSTKLKVTNNGPRLAKLIESISH